MTYYSTREDLTQSTTFASALSAMIEEAVEQALANPTKTLTQTIRFMGKANVGSQIAVETYDIIVNGEDNSVTVGGAVIDMSINAAGTALTIALLGLTSLSIVPLAIATVAATGAVAYLYSAFAEEFVDDWWLTLNGQDEIEFYDANGDHAAGLIFPDGFTGSAADAAYAFITHPSSQTIANDNFNLRVAA